MKTKLILIALLLSLIGSLDSFAACNCKDADGNPLTIEVAAGTPTLYSVVEADPAAPAPAFGAMQAFNTRQAPNTDEKTVEFEVKDKDGTVIATSGDLTIPLSTAGEDLELTWTYEDGNGNCEAKFIYTAVKIASATLKDSSKKVSPGDSVSLDWFDITTEPTGYESSVTISDKTKTVDAKNKDYKVTLKLLDASKDVNVPLAGVDESTISSDSTSTICHNDTVTYEITVKDENGTDITSHCTFNWLVNEPSANPQPTSYDTAVNAGTGESLSKQWVIKDGDSSTTMGQVFVSAEVICDVTYLGTDVGGPGYPEEISKGTIETDGTVYEPCDDESKDPVTQVIDTCIIAKGTHEVANPVTLAGSAVISADALASGDAKASAFKTVSGDTASTSISTGTDTGESEISDTEAFERDVNVERLEDKEITLKLLRIFTPRFKSWDLIRTIKYSTTFEESDQVGYAEGNFEDGAISIDRKESQ